MKSRTSYWVTALAVSLSIAVRVQAVSTIQFTATSYTTSEIAGAAILTVQRTGDITTEVGVDYATADRTATNGLKYIAVSGSLTFGASETNRIILVPILNNGFVDGAKVFHVFLSDPTGGAVLGARTNAAVLITDNDVGIQFQFATNSVIEDAGAVMIGVVRGDDGILPVTVDLFTTDLTAKSGIDYIGATNTLSFAPQERLKFISIPILNNTLKEPNGTFRVALANSAGATLGSQKTATVTIVDNDQGFQFEFASYSVTEDAGVARIGVLRGTDDTNSAVSVDFATSDLTATSGQDYQGSTNTLSFAPGERVKRVTIPIINDGVKEPTMKFSATLSSPTGGGVLSARTTTTVSILGNDPGVGFETAQYTNAWGNPGGITLTVLRGNDRALGPITVDYATENLSAKGGEDYQAVSGTLQFQKNETVKSVTIPLLRHRAVEGTKAFRVTLSNPTGGAALGTSAATVSIVGAYFTIAPSFDTALTIRHDLGFNTIAWAGGGQLQRADSPTGPWQTLANASSPYAVQSALPASCYRVTRPRPVNLYVPSSYDGQTPLPLVILLHSYTPNGDWEESFLHIRPLAEARGFLYCHPDSALDRIGAAFWNATDAGFDLFNTGTDDAGYLRNLIEEISQQFAVDRKRISLVGNSGGAFMAHRMACQFADLIAGIASRAGATFLDPSRCEHSQPVNILQIHGTKDARVFYDGGASSTTGVDPQPVNMPAFPGPLKTIELWAGYNGASDPVTEPGPSLDLDLNVPGLDTVITRYTDHPPGGAVELWKIIGGDHFISPSPSFSPHVIDWLLAHPKP